MVKKNGKEDGGRPQEPACTLEGVELTRRLGKLRELAAAAVERTEIDDGIALRFEASEELAVRAAALIAAERRCCRFLEFELIFEKDLGPIWLRVRGPDSRRLVASLIAT